MDTNQFMERYRNLSRDIQNELQKIQKSAQAAIQEAPENKNIAKIIESHCSLSEAWHDFAQWILISTIDATDDISTECAKGLISTKGKVTRSITKRRRDLQAKKISFDHREVEDFTLTTYIPYFEQLLDLAIGNAIKYTPLSYSPTIACKREHKNCVFYIDSMGPLVEQAEIQLLGSKGFRSKAASNSDAIGGGQGLYYMLRISELIGASTSFRPTPRESLTIKSIPYANFQVRICLPFEVDQ